MRMNKEAYDRKFEIAIEDSIARQNAEPIWTNLFHDYRELVKDTTEAPEIFHYASFLIVIGQIIQRKYYVVCSVPIFPAFYICLVGESGLSRKTASWLKAEPFIMDLYLEDYEKEDPKFSIVSEATVEAIFKRLHGEGKSMLFNPGEFRSFIEKAKQQSSSNLIPKITELYDHRKFIEKITVGQGSHKPKECFFQFITNTDINWLSSLNKNDMLGGFGNRFLYACGKSDRRIPRPPDVDREKYQVLLRKLNDLRRQIDNSYKYNKNQSVEMKFTSEADKIYEKYYIEYYYPMADQINLSSSMLKRQTDYVLKIALIYAVMNGENKIDVDSINKAILAVKYFEYGTRKMFNDYEKSPKKDEENRILQYIIEKSNVTEKINMRDIYRNLHMDSESCRRDLESLEKIGEIELNRNGKSYYVKLK